MTVGAALTRFAEYFFGGTPYAVVTFYPVTLENDTAEIQLEELIHAMDSLPEMKYIVTLELLERRGVKAVVSVCEAEHSPLWCNTLPENDVWTVLSDWRGCFPGS